jgi:hypothetical protein
MITIIELLPPGVKSEPLFTPEQYEQFRQDWQKNVVPELEKHEEAHQRSIEDSIRRPLLRLVA